MKHIDLNADLGEGYGPWSMGDDAAMLTIVSSANIACGGHAGDAETMFAACSTAARNGVAIGAHPGYDDRPGFGRRIIPMPTAQLERMVASQIGSLQAIAALVPTNVTYVKAHGALGNLAARDADVAAAIVDTVQRIDEDLAILAISGTVIEQVARSAGMNVFSEVFADRGYRSDGQLVPRGEPGDLIHDPEEAAQRLIEFLDTGIMPTVDGVGVALNAESICVHGDSPGALAMARSVRSTLTRAGFVVESFRK